MFTTVLQVALGGAIGAAARFGVGVALFRPGAFPVAVLSVNVIGSFLMGLAVVYLGQKTPGSLTPFLMTGVLGGFTTFSAFSLEAYTLFERGEIGQAALYVALSVILSLAALVAGVFIMRGVLA
ncbi:fluoride efflux transporter CrcB [Pseudooctadecabacter sp.]|uniref:fluoride efflux transporter CrcB n=1 Tax=Pseudooctadecabacter sp. TaxID=1966338 RepID=UPI0025F03435|nr:fluoride efflux transporter CrcB [Pseudooctadecabacter sp.]